MLMVLAPRENFLVLCFDNRLPERFIYKSVMGEEEGSSVKTHFLKYGEIWSIEYNFDLIVLKPL
jgi:hypothetical protein